jgi:predicted AAA+ superfamily ATPase
VPSIKRLVDEDKRPGMYVLTGSQQWSVLKSIGESLAGRAVFLDLDGFALSEAA